MKREDLEPVNDSYQKSADEVVSYPKRKMGIGLVIALCLVIGIVIGGGATYYMLTHLNRQNEEIKENDESKNNSVPKTAETLSVDDKLVRELFDSMNAFKNSYSINGKNIDFSYFYLKNELANEEVDDAMMFAISFNSLYKEKYNIKEDNYDKSELENFRFSFADINKMSQKLFGRDVVFDKAMEYNSTDYPDLGITPGYQVKVGVNGFYIKYDEEKKEFFLNSFGMGGPDEIEFDVKITGVQKYDDRIEITNKVIFEYFGICNGEKVTKLYKEASTAELLFCDNVAINLAEEIADVSHIEKDNIKIDDYLNELDSFKWTFIKDEKGNYVFSKVEKIVN